MTAIASEPRLSASSVKVSQTKMLIDGKWVNSTSGRTFETINPATGDVIAHVAEGEATDVDKAVRAARRARGVRERPGAEYERPGAWAGPVQAGRPDRAAQGRAGGPGDARQRQADQ